VRREERGSWGIEASPSTWPGACLSGSGDERELSCYNRACGEDHHRLCGQSAVVKVQEQTMNTVEAADILRKHNGQTTSDEDTFLKCLRPYSGIKHAHFCEIVKAIYFAAPLLSCKDADRDVVYTIWDLTRTARSWTDGPHDHKLPKENFISPEDKQILDRWIFVIETVTLYLLRGFEDWEAITGLSDEINLYNSLPDTQWLVAPFIRQLEYHLNCENEGGYGDDEESLCAALSKIGEVAQPALPVLKRIVEQTKYPHVRAAAEKAVSAIRGE
jgi:hypothetical protein